MSFLTLDQKMTEARLLSTCTREAIEASGDYALLVYGRTRIWYKSPSNDIPYKNLSNDSLFHPHWSEYAWWKAMWYPHRGSPGLSSSWGVYAGSNGVTGPGDAELTHWLPMPEAPDAEMRDQP